jgi:hypothetical protein
MTSMKSIDSWTFLVSANRYLDYRTVVAPDFLCKIKKTSIIARNAGGDLIPYKISHVYDEKIGNLTLAFRVIEAIADNLNIEGSGTLKDSFGREIYLIEGLCFKDKIHDIQLSDDDFVIIHNKIKPSFQEFWSWSTGKSPIESYPEEYKGHFTPDKSILEDKYQSVVNQRNEIKKEIDQVFPQSKNVGKKKIGFQFFKKKPLAMSILLLFFIGILILVAIKIVLY